MARSFPWRLSRQSRAAVRKDTDLLGKLAPTSAHLAVWYLENQDDDSYQIAAFILAVLSTMLGTLLLGGDWYTSIQGVRSPLVEIGVIKREHLWSFPSLYWWPMPIILTLAQVLPRLVPGGRFMWWPAIIFNGVTTALFAAFIMRLFAAAYGLEYDIVTVGILSSCIGLVVSVMAENAVLFGLLVLRCAIRWS